MSKKDELRNEMVARAKERDLIRASGIIEKDMSLGIEMRGEGGVYIDINLIHPSPYQLRRVFPQEYIESLAESIRNEGLNQPIVVVKRGDIYELIAGENRHRACKYLGMEEILCVIRNVDDNLAARSVVADNLQHNTLSDYETFIGLTILENMGIKTASEQSRIIGRDRKHIWRVMQFKNMPEKVIDMLEVEPGLFGASCAEILASYVEAGHDELVLQAVEKIKENKIKQMSAGTWIESKLQVKPLTRVKEPLKLIGGKEIGNIIINNNKIEINITDVSDNLLIDKIKALIMNSMLTMEPSSSNANE